MYNPSHFTESRVDVLHALIRAHPLGTLVTLGPDGLVANHVPVLLRAHEGVFGTLVAHVARANPVWNTTDLSVQVLLIFQGPQAYISPNWYPTKQQHGKVVPTWNYAVVHARGTLQVHDDAQWVRTQVTELTAQQESVFTKPWAVDDAPRDYTDTMLKALVGIEIPVTTLQGKWKVSQNQSAINRQGVSLGLQVAQEPQAAAIADLVQLHAPQ